MCFCPKEIYSALILHTYSHRVRWKWGEQLGLHLIFSHTSFRIISHLHVLPLFTCHSSDIMLSVPFCSNPYSMDWLILSMPVIVLAIYLTDFPLHSLTIVFYVKIFSYSHLIFLSSESFSRRLLCKEHVYTEIHQEAHIPCLFLIRNTSLDSIP